MTEADDPDAVVARVKLFSPYIGWRWYITEWEAETGLCFGLVEGFETEFGLLRSDRAGGGDRLRKRPRRGARPLLGAADPRRDQERVEGDGGLASGARERSRRRIGKEIPCLTRLEPQQLARMHRAPTTAPSPMWRKTRLPQSPERRTPTGRPHRNRRVPTTARSRPLPPEELKVSRVHQGRQGHHRGATAQVRPAHRVVRRP